VRVEIFPRAEADIINQFRYYLIDQDAPLVAIRFREAVIECIKQLKPHPRIGSIFRGSIHGLRSWPVKGFDMIRIYYLEAPDSLRVVRILHGRRNIRQILKGEELQLR
jgi:plasmid stabilization system protein ParE